MRSLISNLKEKLKVDGRINFIHMVKCQDRKKCYIGQTGEKKLATRTHEHKLATKRHGLLSMISILAHQNGHKSTLDAVFVVDRAET